MREHTRFTIGVGTVVEGWVLESHDVWQHLVPSWGVMWSTCSGQCAAVGHAVVVGRLCTDNSEISNNLNNFKFYNSFFWLVAIHL